MFKQESKKENFKEVETVIGPSVKVKGNFESEGNIIVEGALEGSIKTAGKVLIGEKAIITADIQAGEAQIAGKVKGNIKTKNSLDIYGSAKITGDLQCLSLSVEKGAVLNGQCLMSKQEEKQE